MARAEIPVRIDTDGVIDRILARASKTRLADWMTRTSYHPPRSPAVVAAHEKARALIGETGLELIRICPASPELSLALDALDLTLMHANAAIARRHPDNQPNDEDAA